MEAGVDPVWGNILHPVFLEGAGKKVWQVLPEVSARRFSKESSGYRTGQVFYIGEVPMTPAEKTQIGLARVDYCIEDKRKRLDAFGFREASDGGDSVDYSERNIPSAEKLFIRALGLFKPARDAGMMRDVGQRVDAIKVIMSQIAAMKGLSERERQIIHGMYERGSPAYEAFMKWWLGSGVNTYVEQLEQRGEFTWGYGDTLASSRKERKRLELSSGVPFGEAIYRGFFNADALRVLSNYGEISPYLEAVRRTLEIAASNIMSRSDWRRKPFTIKDVETEAVRLIDESLFWNVVRQSFKGVNVQQVWERLLLRNDYSHEPSLWERIAQPYVDKVKEAVAL